MRKIKKIFSTKGFALPAVLIAGIVALIIGVSAMQLISSSTRSIIDDDWTRKAQAAKNAGIKYVQECARNTSNPSDPLKPWIDSNKPITQSTDCVGNTISGGAQYILDSPATGDSPRWYSTFSASVPSSIASFSGTRKSDLIGQVSIIGKGGNVVKTYTSKTSLVLNGTAISTVPAKPIQLAVNGNGVNCGITTSNDLYCAGGNTFGRLGNGTSTNSSTPVKFQLPSGGYAQSVDATNIYITCVLTTAAEAYCAGPNSSGALGNGTNTGVTTIPSKFQLPGGLYAQSVQSTTGDYRVCVAASNLQLYCAGDNGSGQLGNGTTTSSNIPVKFQLPAGNYVQSSSIDSNVGCVLTSALDVYCAGSGFYGSLGNGGTANSSTPVKFQLPSGLSAQNVLTSGGVTCVVASSQDLYCAGINTFGQLGNGGTTNSSTPVKFQLPSGLRATQISIGSGAACARTSSQEVYCAGSNFIGRLGVGTTTNVLTPSKFQMPSGLANFVYLSNPNGAVCVISSLFELYCAGSNSTGQLGNGTTTNSNIPVQFSIP